MANSISWNEVGDRAIKSWAGVVSEAAETQTFWDEFFEFSGFVEEA